MHTVETDPHTCSVLCPTPVSFQQQCAFKDNRFPTLIPEAQLYGIKFGVWCALSAARTTGPIFLFDTINSNQYVVTHILTTIFVHLSDYERTYAFRHQHSTTAHTLLHCLECLWGQNSKLGIVASSFTRSEPTWLFLVGMFKHGVYSTDPCTEHNIIKITWEMMSSFLSADLQRAVHKVCVTCNVPASCRIYSQTWLQPYDLCNTSSTA